jgi:hypothetical protein
MPEVPDVSAIVEHVKARQSSASSRGSGGRGTRLALA